MACCCAVLLDTVSIQQYVFGSNRLRDNLGSSALVKRIYAESLEKCLDEMGYNLEVLPAWKTDYHTVLMNTDSPPPFEVGFIGGGKALLFFAAQDAAISFVKKWSKRLLVQAPGLRTAVAIKPDFNLDEDQFTRELECLFQQLAINKNCYFPNTTLPTHGITAECPRTGLTIDGLTDDEKNEVSSVAIARFYASIEEIKEYRELCEQNAGDKFILPTELGHLGQKPETDSHIAIVNADGNYMGKRFTKCKTLVEYRKLAVDVEQATYDAFGDLIGHVARNVVPYMDSDESAFELTRIDGKTCLPLRPIIIGGDDVTFIAEGRLGIHLAEKFLEFFYKRTRSFGDGINACAGVAIIKTKYPFYRGYELAEQLCSSAKQQARLHGDSSWLDFQLVYGGISGPLDSIRKQQVHLAGIELFWGPYLVIGNHSHNDRSFQKFKSALARLNDEKVWPRSKIKELRTTFYEGQEMLELKLGELRARGITLPDFGTTMGLAERGSADSATPYHDLIEALDYYPPFLLMNGGETH
jgi:hypothetical protein